MQWCYVAFIKVDWCVFEYFRFKKVLQHCCVTPVVVVVSLCHSTSSFVYLYLGWFVATCGSRIHVYMYRNTSLCSCILSHVITMALMCQSFMCYFGFRNSDPEMIHRQLNHVHLVHLCTPTGIKCGLWRFVAWHRWCNAWNHCANNLPLHRFHTRIIKLYCRFFKKYVAHTFGLKLYMYKKDFLMVYKLLGVHSVRVLWHISKQLPMCVTTSKFISSWHM